MTKHIDTKKIEILKQIASLDSVSAIEAIERYLKQIQYEGLSENIFKQTRNSISVEELKKEQGYIFTDKTEIDQIAQGLSIEEPIEELFAMLKR